MNATQASLAAPSSRVKTGLGVGQGGGRAAGLPPLEVLVDNPYGTQSFRNRDLDRVGGWAACRAPSRPQHGIARWEPRKT